MVHTKYQAPDLAVLEKKIFKYILFWDTRPPAAKLILTPGPPFEQTW